MRFRNEWPPANSTRTITRFLWLPLKIKCETRWLERAAWIERCVHYVYALTGEPSSYKWIPTEWVNVSHSLEREEG